MLDGCLDQTLFSDQKTKPGTFGHYTFDDILYILFKNSSKGTTRHRSKQSATDAINNQIKKYKTLNSVLVSSSESVPTSSSWTHNQTPNSGQLSLEDVLKMRREKNLRAFVKLSNISPSTDCYHRFYNKTIGTLHPGYVQCLILDGLWKPPPIPGDLYAATKYFNDLAWIILSSKNTGSQLHIDPDLMGAWNLLLMGRKWWVVSPTHIPIDRITCMTKCSPGFQDGSNTWPWFQQVLPQIKGKRLTDISKHFLYSKKILFTDFMENLCLSLSSYPVMCCTCHKECRTQFTMWMTISPSLKTTCFLMHCQN